MLKKNFLDNQMIVLYNYINILYNQKEIKMRFLPGTKLEVSDISSGFEYILPSIRIANGLTLAQVRTITGLEQSTIQNWIKRGWVAHPENKRYGEYQLARIIIINMLRASMQLENIARLLRFINGEADCRADDIIPDSILYTHLCAVIAKTESKHIFDSDEIKAIAEEEVKDYKETLTGAKQKLCDALTVMTLAYISSEIQHTMEDYYSTLGIE